MRTPAVVVVRVDPERSIQMPPPPDERPVEALGVASSRSPVPRRRRRWRSEPGTGVRMTRIPSERSTVSNGPVNFASRSRMRKRTRLTRASRSRARFRACSGDPRRVGVNRCGAEVDPPAAELDEHEAGERPEPGGLDGAEVAGDDAIRVRAEELGPRWAGPSWAGPARAVRSRVRIVVAATRIPSFRSSPSIRTQPQRGFSRARRRMSARSSASIGGRPGRPVFWYVHFLRTSSRCHRRSVAGVTRKATHRSRGIARLAAASRTRSMVRSLSGPAVRRSTRS